MEKKELIAEELEAEGAFCTLGVVGHERGLDMQSVDPDDPEVVAKLFGIAPALVREIVFMNDEWPHHTETPAQRWSRMRGWAEKQLAKGVEP
ncbi:hypothetical protein J2D73_20005 [Acetobacter sacchari]|uniref:Uncharacterized protein n=1 Tax=Acetobacter sacchari TaxID=2661687 RepID=A0ABS3M1Q1_9PROT|nr:hypothetical protein [Acetobacter sacchari]MBO1362069.1 hypothetical protein [Acetobacter sacchari]